ncbi:MAG: UDP-N-acetylmuramate--L-alanine ligase [Bacillota bacterium]|nr:UDP-N-acetylmuramate--L-alanine ligase [Bacillota bacterium]
MDCLDPLESDKLKYIHFIGIGGISMSGLAEILLHLGYEVTGSDMKSSGITQKLEKKGVNINIGHSEDNIKNPDLVVYTAAVKENNPELMKARRLNIPVVDRATLLGNIMKKYPYGIAISGTHGKTTTTSMITMIMLESKLDPTVHIGGELEAIGGNTKIGGSGFFIAEACEYVESFLKFYPYLAVVLNIELDHVDYFRDLDHIKSAFSKFAALVPKDGYLVVCNDDPNAASLAKKVDCNVITYGINSKDAQYTAQDIVYDEMGCASYKLFKDGKKITSMKLNIPGIHNVSNSLAAVAACSMLGCDMAHIREGLRKFTGAHKRFELKGDVDDIRVIDDYAHHPSEIKATLKAAKNCAHSKIWCIFQPHTYSRTKSLMGEFAKSFNDADVVIVSDIYAAREADTGEVHASMLADKINAGSQKAVYIHDFDNIVKYLEDNVSPGDLVITMGAGDIVKVGEMFIKNKQAKEAAVS